MAVKASTSITLFNVMDMDSVDIGGRNLWVNSSFDYDTDYYKLTANTGDISVTNGYENHKALKLTRADYTGTARCNVITSDPPTSSSYKAGDSFTLSAWVYVKTALDADNNNIIVRGSVGDKPSLHIPSNTEVGEWIRLTDTYTAVKDGTFSYCGVLLGKNGSLMVSEIKLEKGNKATDWTPAPEDLASKEEVKAVETQLVDAEINISQSNEEYVLEALKEYVGANEYGEFTEEVTSELKALAEEITLKFTENSTRTEEVNNELIDRFTEFEKYFEFSTNGLVIKTGDNSEMQLVIDNDIISFQKNGEQFGWWDGMDFHTGNIVVDVDEKAQFGNFAFVPRSDGSLSFLKVGE